MKFLELTDIGGEKVYFNPKNIVSLIRHNDGTKIITNECIPNGNMQPYDIVKQSVSEVISMLSLLDD